LVKTSYGRIRGYINNGIYTFRGVRYGASTGGENRFMPPKPPEPWMEIRDASSYGYRAPQTNPATQGGGIALTGGGEAARKMADRLSETWIAFAATGNPNTDKSRLPQWDPYDTVTRPTMISDNECRVALDPLKEQRLIFEPSPGETG
jgi:carboxylesterase type B